MCIKIAILILFVVVTSHAQLPTHGLGGSTYTCLDRDADGYGTGSGCTGPDADDLDATVHTGAQGISKYGTLAAFLAHLGYTPTRIWYIATSGNDSTCVSAGAPVGIGSPCLTFGPPGTNLAAGDMVMYRAGTYLEAARFTPSVNGTSSAPIVAMGYPGEAVTIDTSATFESDMNVIDRSYVTIDGFILTKGQNNGCIAGGTSTYGLSSNTFHNNIVRHVEAYSCIWGFIAAGLDNVIVEDSVFHDNAANGGQHGIYIGAKGNLLSSNDTIHRVITYNNGYTGIQVNGNVAGLVEDQNISYGNLIADYSWENGVHDSFFRSDIAMSWEQSGGLVISEYNGNEGLSACGVSGTDPCVCLPTPNLASACPHDQTGNLIENFTAYGTVNGSDGVSAMNSPGILVGRQPGISCTTASCTAANLGSNTFRNIVAAAYTEGSGSYMPLVFPDGGTGWPQSSTLDHLVLWENDSTHSANVFGYGPGSSFGSQGYTCAAPPSGVTLSNCFNSDPQFIAANPTWWNAISSFDFRLSPSSPALRTGSATSLPPFDLVGRAYTGSPAPSMGALERQLYVHGWNDLGGASALTLSVCPADGASGSVAQDGSPYLYQFFCHKVYDAWNSAILRDKPQAEAMFLWGGGHNDSADNSVYKLTVNTTSPTMSRVINPSQVTAADYTSSPTGLPDGSPTAPNSRHTWGQLTYLPNQDEMWTFNGCVYGGCPELQDTWTLSLSSLIWTRQDPTNGFQPFGSVESWTQSGASAYDKVSDAVYTFANDWALAYAPGTNTYTLGNNDFGGGAYPSAVVDTSRRKFQQIGKINDTIPNGFMFSLDISGGPSSIASVHATCEISTDAAPFSGCTADIDPSCDGLLNSDAPGLFYHSVLDRIVGYPMNGGNVVYFMDPGSKSCTTQTFTGGPPSNGLSSPLPGLYGKFNYSQNMDVAIAANGFNQNTFVLNLNASDPGGSTSNGTAIGGNVVISGATSVN